VTVSRTGAWTVARLRAGDVSGGSFTVQGDDRDLARDLCADMARTDILVGIYFDAGSSPFNAGCVTGYESYFAASGAASGTPAP
jgi:hypothetical protein